MTTETARTSWRSRLPRRTVRLQLTALYAGVLAISGAVLLAITIGALFGFRGRAMMSITGVVRQNQFAKDFTAIVIGGGVALAVMTVASLWIGWLLAGRVLRPLRSITAAARDISATNLHRRLALAGPDDELRELGDTFDGLLHRLDASFSAQRRFVANASHELRTPLARLKTQTQVALADPNADAVSLREAHERVLASEAQLEQLLDALLTLAAGEEALRSREQLGLAAIARQVLAARTAEIDARGLRVDVTLDPAAINGDARLIERLLDNLIDNAIRHSSRNSWLAVTTNTSAGRAVITVANAGPVISPPDLDRIRQPFGRGTGEPGGERTGERGGERTRERTRERTGDGHGLGLSIVDAIAAAHGAKVSMRALPEGGLSVEVQFPADLPSSGSGG